MVDHSSRHRIRAVLFDFDGTLADTATDLGNALNRMRIERGLASLPISDMRPHASSGARGLLRIGFGIQPGDADYTAMRETFLNYYSERVCVDTRLFPGVSELLRSLDAIGIAWGIVTNKPTRFTLAILSTLQLTPACTVCGDTTPHPKPHPAPLLLAAERLGLASQSCCYVGDDLRDIQAARAAQMRAVAVEYGYTGTDNGNPATWNADVLIAHPRELIAHL
jgi:N-acetyl-D-muramate 6-phosphate phosphatase